MKIFFSLLWLSIFAKATTAQTTAQFTLEHLKHVRIGQSSESGKMMFNQLTGKRPNILCSENNLLKVKQIEYNDAVFDFWGESNETDLLFVKDSLIFVQNEFNFQLGDTAGFNRFLIVVFNQLTADTELSSRSKVPQDFRPLLRTIYKENIVPIRHYAKNYYRNLFDINSGDNYFQVFIDISIVYDNETNKLKPIFKFTLRLNNFTLATLQDFYFKELGSLPLSSQNCR